MKYKVYRNDSELAAAFAREVDAEIYIQAINVVDDYKICYEGKVIYNTRDEV